jgi:hypothetical protein
MRAADSRSTTIDAGERREIGLPRGKVESARAILVGDWLARDDTSTHWMVGKPEHTRLFGGR